MYTQVQAALQFGLPWQMSPDLVTYQPHPYPELYTSSQLANLTGSGPWGDPLAVSTINKTTFQLMKPLHGLFTDRFNCSEKLYKNTMQFTPVPPYSLTAVTKRQGKEQFALPTHTLPLTPPAQDLTSSTSQSV